MLTMNARLLGLGDRPSCCWLVNPDDCRRAGAVFLENAFFPLRGFGAGRGRKKGYFN